MNDNAKPKTYIDLLSGECRALSERFCLSGEQSDILREFVTDMAMRSWRNGRACGWIRGRNDASGETGEGVTKA
jgi:hypothetical protein